jgi:RNA recognition motif-containing protein
METDKKLESSLDTIAAAERAAGGRKPRPAGGPVRGAGNRVYVGNLPWQVSWQDLKDHFRQAGEPVYTTVFLDEDGRSKGCGIVEYATKEEAQKAIQTLNDTTIGESQRLIFVREDREERPPAREPREARAPREPGQEFPRRAPAPRRQFAAAPPRAERAAPLAPPAPAADGGAAVAGASDLRDRQVFVGNLPYTTSWQDLKDIFRTAGTIVRADVVMLPNGKSKGQGTVLFDTKAAAQAAIEMFDNSEVQGRKIVVHEDRYA